MRPTLIQRAQYGLQSDGLKGVNQWRPRVKVDSYKSAYGPQYKIAPHIAGISIRGAMRYARFAGAFGVAAGTFALFFFNGIPRVQKDILQKIPFVADYYTHEIPPEDNPF